MAEFEEVQDHDPPLEGRISMTNRFGRPGTYGLVVLDTSLNNLLYAVIGDGTKGRIELMNKTGKLEEGTKVFIPKTRRGGDGYEVLEVRPA